MDFAHEQLAPDDARRVADFFHHRGAYGRFKDLLERKNQLQHWYDYERQAKQQRLRQWCAVPTPHRPRHGGGGDELLLQPSCLQAAQVGIQRQLLGAHRLGHGLRAVRG